jgi:sulfur carrier protein
MQITVNGESWQIDEKDMTVSRLLIVKNVESPDMVSVQINGDILEREQYESVGLANNDEVDFLYFMGGGSRS